MRRITYAGETVITTDPVAAALVDLTAALAKIGQAEAVTIPIVYEDRDGSGDAELVIGLGNDVLSVPVDWDGAEPDFSEYEEGLRAHSALPQKASNVVDLHAGDDTPYDPDLEIDRA
jgi:hypothetical protein